MIKPASDFITEARVQINCLDAVAAKRLYDQEGGKALIVDVREEDATMSRLASAVNIARGLIEMKMPMLCPAEDTLILVHCAGGGRASLATARLQEMGYTNAYAITDKYEDIKAIFG